MKRRSFAKYLLGAAILASPVIRMLSPLLPRKFVRAVRSRSYPGPVVAGAPDRFGAAEKLAG